MTLGETMHIARQHSSANLLGCYVATVHVPAEGTAGKNVDEDHANALDTFRSVITIAAEATVHGEGVGLVLFDPSTAHGSRGIELTTAAESVHAALVGRADDFNTISARA
eukprot:SAG31_NODE_4151_length_3528_cov_2.301546_2_plen_110_part_00